MVCSKPLLKLTLRRIKLIEGGRGHKRMEIATQRNDHSIPQKAYALKRLYWSQRIDFQ